MGPQNRDFSADLSVHIVANVLILFYMKVAFLAQNQSHIVSTRATRDTLDIQLQSEFVSVRTLSIERAGGLSRVSASRSRPCLRPPFGGGFGRQTTACLMVGPASSRGHRDVRPRCDRRLRHGTVTRAGRDPELSGLGRAARQGRAVGPGRGPFGPRGAQELVTELDAQRSAQLSPRWRSAL